MILSTWLLLSSDAARLEVWCAIGICAGLFVFIRGFRLLQRRHLILNTPLSRIRSASLGMVELNGLAVGPYTTVAPVTARSCFYYRTMVWEWKRQGRSKRWVQVATECMHVPFFLDDNTGRVMVDPRGAELDLHRDFHQQFSDSFFTAKEPAPVNVRSFLLRHGVDTSNKIKVEEFCIKPKNCLFLLGTLHENPGLELTPEPIYDDDTRTPVLGNGFSLSLADVGLGGGLSSFGLGSLTSAFTSDPLDGPGETPVEERSIGERLVGHGIFHESAFNPAPAPDFDLVKSPSSPSGIRPLSASAHQVVHLSPSPASARAADMTQQQKIAAALVKAGISNPAAWRAAGIPEPGASLESSANSAAQGPIAPPAGFDQRPAVVLMKGQNNPAFLISWRGQSEIARSLVWKCSLMIWGGPAIALLCLYALLALAHQL